MGRGPSRVCFRCGKHGHFLSECRAVPPTRFPGPYTGAQATTYLDEDYADFGSGPPPSQSAPAPPDQHGPPVPSESSWSSFSEQATLAQFAPPGKSHVPNESVVGDVTVPASYLHGAFVVQSGSNEDDVWIADSGVSCHMTHDGTRMYNARPPPPGRETITIGNRRRINVEYIGNMDVIFHGKSDQRITLIDVVYVPDLGFNLYSLHAVQRTHLIVSDASGTHMIGANLTFPRSSSGSYLRATRLPAGTVGARRRQGDMRATNLLRQLGHSIPPPSQEPPLRRNMCATGLQNSGIPGVVTVLEPTPFPPLSSVLGEIQFVGKTPSRPACRIGTPPLAATALIPGSQKHGKEVDINHLHVSLAHAHASVLKATAKQHGILLTGELFSCSACSRAKGHRAPTPHHATRRATQRLGLVHNDTAGPYPTYLGVSRDVVIFVDSASRLQRPHGVREKSVATILSVVKRFVADMGFPRAFRTDNGTEYSNSMFVDFCNDLGIRREFTAPHTPQQNGPVESAISRALKAGHAARLGVPQLYPYIRLEEIQGCTDAAGTSLWLESLLWASECYNRAATSVNDEWIPPHEIFYGSRPRLPLLPFLQPAYHRLPQQRKTDPRARMCYFLNCGYNPGRDCYRLLDAETGRVAYSRDVT